jgi:hypothetical protein
MLRVDHTSIELMVREILVQISTFLPSPTNIYCRVSLTSGKTSQLDYISVGNIDGKPLVDTTT